MRLESSGSGVRANCLVCEDLFRVLEAANSDYKAARSSAYYLVSTEIAARMQVDMERAKSALSVHLASCQFVSVIDYSSLHSALTF